MKPKQPHNLSSPVRPSSAAVLFGDTHKFTQIIRLILTALAVIVPFVFYPDAENVYSIPKMTLIQFSGLILLGMVMVYYLRCGVVELTKEKGHVAAAAMLVTGAVSLMFAQNKPEAVFYLRNSFALIFIGWLAGEVFSGENRIRKILMILIGVGIANACLDFIYQGGINFSAPRESHRILLGHYNFASEYMIAPFMAAAGMMFYPDKSAKILSAAGAVIMGIFIVTAQTRGVWIGSIAGMTVMAAGAYALFHSQWPRKIKILFFGVPAIAAGVVFAVIFLSREASPVKEAFPSGLRTLSARFWSAFDPQNYARKTRLLVWRDTLEIIKAKPVIGHGPGNFKVAHMGYRSREEREFTGKNIIYEKAHNEYLNLASEMGLVGLACLIFIVGRWYVILVSSLRGSDPDSRILALPLLGILTGCLTQGVFGYNIFTIPGGAFSFWFCGGLIWALSKRNAQLRQERQVFTARVTSGQNGLKIFLAAVALFAFFTSVFVVPRRFVSNVFIEKGIRAYRANRLTAAQKHLDRAEKWYWADEQIGFFLGRIYQRHGEKYRKEKKDEYAKMYFQKSIEAYKKALRIFPYYEIIINNLGAVYTLNHQPQEAFRIYQEAVALNPLHAGTRMNLAMYYRSRKNWTKAEDEINIILKVEPEFFDENPQFVKYRDEILDEVDSGQNAPGQESTP